MYKVLSICLAFSLAMSEITTAKQNTVVDLTKDQANIKVYLVDDNCPNNSWKEVDKKFDLNIIKHTKNLGVGRASITGFKAAKKD